MDDTAVYEEILRLRRVGESAVLAMVIASSGSSPRKAGAKMLVRADGSVVGTVGGGGLEDEARRAAAEVLAAGKPRTRSFSLTAENDMVCGGTVILYLEPLRAQPRLVIVGSGHVGQALARAARPAGFEVVLVEPEGTGPGPRVEGFAPPDLRCPPGAVFEKLPADGRTLVVVATRSHGEDFAAVKGALAAGVPFLGMLGSRRKREALRDYLVEAGFETEDIDRVRTPVGFSIGAQTPAEIAVSILAQLIEFRRDHGVVACGHCTGGGAVAADGIPQAAAVDR